MKAVRASRKRTNGRSQSARPNVAVGQQESLQVGLQAQSVQLGHVLPEVPGPVRVAGPAALSSVVLLQEGSGLNLRLGEGSMRSPHLRRGRTVCKTKSLWLQRRTASRYTRRQVEATPAPAGGSKVLSASMRVAVSEMRPSGDESNAKFLRASTCLSVRAAKKRAPPVTTVSAHQEASLPLEGKRQVAPEARQGRRGASALHRSLA